MGQQREYESKLFLLWISAESDEIESNRVGHLDDLLDHFGGILHSTAGIRDSKHRKVDRRTSSNPTMIGP